MQRSRQERDRAKRFNQAARKKFKLEAADAKGEI